MMLNKICAICKKEYEGYGNKSYFYDGKICDHCNKNVEIKKRVEMIINDK